MAAFDNATEQVKTHKEDTESRDSYVDGLQLVFTTTNMAKVDTKAKTKKEKFDTVAKTIKAAIAHSSSAAGSSTAPESAAPLRQYVEKAKRFGFSRRAVRLLKKNDSNDSNVSAASHSSGGSRNP